MTLTEACNIFANLPANFTEEDLRKEYYRLSKAYHPDLNIGLSVAELKRCHEKMKEINEANDLLLVQFFNKEPKISTDIKLVDFGVEIYYKAKIRVLENLASYDINKKYPTYFYMYANYIKRIATKFAKLGLNNTFDIDRYFASYSAQIKEYYQKLKNAVFKEHYVDGFKDENILNYNVPLREFYEQLMKIVQKYSKKLKFLNELNQNVVGYQKMRGYSHLKKLIDNAVFLAKTKAEQNNYADGASIIASMQENIDELFAQHYQILDYASHIRRIFLEKYGKDTLLALCDISTNNIIMFAKAQGILVSEIEMYLTLTKIERTYEKDSGINDTLEKLIELKEKVDLYFQREQEKPQVDALYRDILSKYNNRLLVLTALRDYSLKNNVLAIFMQVVELFTKYSNGEISLDELMKIEAITFLDLGADQNLIATILASLRESGYEQASELNLKKHKMDE